MVLLEFSIAPLNRGDGLSAYVARALDIIDRSGLPYQLTPMGTIVEAEWDQAMALVTRCFDDLQADCDRIGVQIKVDWRRGGEGRLQSKVAAVESRLGRPLSQGAGTPR